MGDIVRTLTQPSKTARFPEYADDPIAYINDQLRTRITPDQEAITRALIENKRVMVLSCHSSGKCKAESDWVYLSDGRKVKAKQVVGKTFKTLTSTPDGIREVEATAEWNEYEDVYEVITESGRRVIVNNKHPLWTAKNVKTGKQFKTTVNGWTSVGCISTGDLVAVTREFPAFGQDEIEEDEVKLLAHLLTSCFIRDKEVVLIKKGERQFAQLVGLLDGKIGDLFYDQTQSRMKIVGAGPILHLFNKYLITESFKQRRIPEAIFTLKKDQLRLFIKTLLSCNTLVVKNNVEAKVKFYHRSEELIRDLAFALLKFGISCKVYKKDGEDFWVARVLNIEDYVRVFEDNEFLAEGNPDNRLDWRLKDAPPGTYWEKVSEIVPQGKQRTVAICVPGPESYLTSLYEHNSYLAGALTNWHYDAFAESITITTAPTEKSVDDIIWKEVRNHRYRLPESMWDLKPSASRMQSSVTHYAEGLVAATGAGFRGRKSENLMLIFDEADGIMADFWEDARGMLIRPNAKWLCLLNPVDISSRAYWESENNKTWTVIRLSALNHPNVLADLLFDSDPSRIPFPGIDMNLQWVNDRIVENCLIISSDAAKLGDFEWPPRIITYFGKQYELPESWERYYYRPRAASDFEPRVLGRWPSGSDNTLWSEAMWEACKEQQPEDIDEPVQIGCDPAGRGADKTAIVVRRGKTVLWHERHHGWDEIMTADRLKVLAGVWGRDHAGMTAETVPIMIDITGNNAVYTHKGNFNFVGVDSSAQAYNKDRYPNRRSELWFISADKANNVDSTDRDLKAGIDISRIEECEGGESWAILGRQLKAAKYILRPGIKETRREVEKKDLMKKRLKESPDDADAFNLAMAEAEVRSGKTIITSATADYMQRHFGGGYRR